jgi:hypothetical protein
MSGAPTQAWSAAQLSVQAATHIPVIVVGSAIKHVAFTKAHGSFRPVT